MSEAPLADGPLPNSQLKATAYHEAGHAVMAHALGRLVKKVTIQPGKSQFGSKRLGVCELNKGRTKATKDLLEEDVLILMAGMVAEARFTGAYCPQGAAQDLMHVRRLLANRARTESQFEKLHRRLLDKTEHMLHDPIAVAAVEWIHNELLERESVSGRAVRHFYQQAETQQAKKGNGN
jgi:ATP-dependent Zn protease